MPQYLLSVHSGPDDYARPMDEMQPLFEAVDRFNQKARDAGVWVFAGGLKPGDAATVVDGTGSEPVLTDGPYLETKDGWNVDGVEFKVRLDFGCAFIDWRSWFKNQGA